MTICVRIILLTIFVIAAPAALATSARPMVQIKSVEVVLSAVDHPLALLNAGVEPKWERNDRLPLNLGTSDAPHWLRLELDRIPHVDELLVVGNPNLYDVAVFARQADGSFIGERFGFVRNNPGRYGSRHFVFPLSGLSEPRIYLRVYSLTPLQVPVRLHTRETLSAESVADNSFLTTIVGIIFAFACYNLLVFASVGRRTYLFYAGYGAGIAILFMTTEGLLPAFVPPGIRPLVLHFASAWGFSCFILFTRRLLLTSRHLPRIDLVLKGLIVACTALPILAVAADLALWYALGSAIAGMTMLACLVAGVSSLRRSKNAPVYLLAFTMPVVGVLLYAGQLAGTLPSTLITRYGMHVGFVFEVIIFSKVLALIINRLNRRIIAKSRKLVRLNRSLAQEIAERMRIAGELEVQRTLLVHTEKMRAIGMLTAAVAHEVNSPLTVLGFGVADLRRIGASTLDPALAARLLETAERQDRMMTRITRVVKSMLTYARSSEAEPLAPISPGQIAEELLDICRVSLSGRDIELEIGEFPQVLVLCRSSEIGQILLNLVNNAADALSGVTAPRIRVTCERRDAVACFSVIDNGPGIPPEVKGKLFTTSITTKAAGKGTGLGLGICKILAERNGSELALVETSRGATFELCVPLAEAAPVRPGSQLEAA